MIRPYVGSWRRLTVQGVAAVVFGLLTLAWPGVTLSTLVALWGAFALVDGAAAVSAAIVDPILRHRGLVALSGVSGIAAGVITFVWPSITALVLLYVIAAWAFVAGSSMIAIAISERRRMRGEWALALTGVLAVILGTVLVITPGAGALAITWAIGWWAMAHGALTLRLAWLVRREANRTPSMTAFGAPNARHALS